MIRIEELKTADEHFLLAINQLLPQLSSSALPITIEDLSELVHSDSTRIFLAHGSQDEVLGMLSLVVFKIPTGTKAWIEDVVVDQSTRGMGVGKSLMNHAKEFARNMEVKTLDLTSRPSREEANRLYQSLGYKVRQTNVYRFLIS